MESTAAASTGYPEMSNALFAKFGAFIQEELGIKMPKVKKTMLQARLQRRMRILGIGRFDAYYDYVFSPEGRDSELIHMIDAVTTNKTHFFREPAHFDYLVTHALPDLIRSTGCGIRRPCMVWSAACSTGEEPYTLAMIMGEFGDRHPDFRYEILGTDISTRVLKTAREAIYSHDKAEMIDMALRKRYLLRSKDRKKNLIRIVPALRQRVRFQRLNFIDDAFQIKNTMDVVFCRNVLIYFNRPTQEKVLNRICAHLKSGGYLFTGHSETLSGLRVPVSQISSNVYKRI